MSLFGYVPYEHLADTRTQHWPLVKSFNVVATLVALYLLTVHYMPKWMSGRKPFELNRLLVWYNFALALLNAYICKELLISSQRLNYNYWCQACNVSYTKDELRLAAAVWWFYISKLLEFCDTFFFILRKKTQQLSFLHVYHHSTMFPLWWIAIKWVPTGSSFFPAMINSFVHVIMYSYYGLSALGAPVQKYLWWKRHLTVLQLCQFTVGLLWALQAIVFDCEFPKWISYVTIGYMISFLLLFSHFYTCKYRKHG